jgi:tRNA modification GTPase
MTGRPNAGKSSLFNALLGRPRAIVHDLPGTTRDVVGETMTLNGAPCVLFDTAGLRQSTEPVEAEGVERARQAAAAADCVVLVVDGAVAEAPGVAQSARAEGLRVDVVAWHKADLSQEEPACDGAPVVRTSVIDGRGLEELRSILASRAAAAMKTGASLRCVVAGDRQVDAVTAALDSMRRAGEAIAGGAPIEVVAAELRSAAASIAEITGERVDEAVLDRVFQRFCVGK